MEIEINRYEKPIIIDGEIELLKKFSALIEVDNVLTIKEIILQNDNNQKSGIYSDIEMDITGFYELEQTITSSWVLRPKFRGFNRTSIKELLINRIKSIKEGVIELPERLFELKTIRIEIDGRLIDVEEVYRKAWDYILYTSIYYRNEYYVNIVFEQSFATWDRNFRLTEQEAKIASEGNHEEITNMISKKRNENR